MDGGMVVVGLLAWASGSTGFMLGWWMRSRLEPPSGGAVRGYLRRRHAPRVVQQEELPNNPPTMTMTDEEKQSLVQDLVYLGGVSEDVAAMEAERMLAEWVQMGREH
jgi:hypothetical protein